MASVSPKRSCSSVSNTFAGAEGSVPFERLPPPRTEGDLPEGLRARGFSSLFRVASSEDSALFPA